MTNVSETLHDFLAAWMREAAPSFQVGQPCDIHHRSSAPEKSPLRQKQIFPSFAKARNLGENYQCVNLMLSAIARPRKGAAHPRARPGPNVFL